MVAGSLARARVQRSEVPLFAPLCDREESIAGLMCVLVDFPLPPGLQTPEAQPLGLSARTGSGSKLCSR